MGNLEKRKIALQSACLSGGIQKNYKPICTARLLSLIGFSLSLHCDFLPTYLTNALKVNARVAKLLANFYNIPSCSIVL